MRFARFIPLLALGRAEPCPPVPADFALSPPQPRGHRELPDPFLTAQGTRVTTKSEWACRRREIAQLAERHELGPIPGPPAALSASLVNDTQLVVRITDNNHTISFTAPIAYPAAGTAPYPVLIGIDGVNIPVPPTVAAVILPLHTLSRPMDELRAGRDGLFHRLHGAAHPAGSTAAAIWGAARLLDALALTAPATRLDVSRVAVAGCSRSGRAALAVGGFDERIALTVVQEVGTGADSCYRLRDDDRGPRHICNTLQCPRYPDGGQTAEFRRFYDYPAELPFDRHSVAALVAPRALLVLQGAEQHTEPRSAFQCMSAAKTVYEALGVGERMAVSLVAGRQLCLMPEDQRELLDAYFAKFLLGEEVAFDTDVVERKLDWEWPYLPPAYTWTVPNLT